MSQTTYNPNQAGILLPCPRCGEARASFSLDLAANHTDEEAFTCRDCDAQFSVDEVRDIIARWTPVVAWLALMPDQPAIAD